METGQQENILQFYLLSTKLKNKVYLASGYTDRRESVAEHIYGSCILALGLYSQIDYNVNIDHVLTLLMISRLDEVIPYLDRYDGVSKIVGNMKKRHEIIELYKEYLMMSSDESVLAHMCDNLEKDIANKKNQEEIKQLIDDAHFFYFFKHLDTSHNNIDSLLHFYGLCTKLKGKIRSGWDSTHWNVKSDRVESVAEHVYGTCMLALAMDSEYKFDINIERVIKMLVLHEMRTALVDDIEPYEGITHDIKKNIEHQATRTVLGDLVYNEAYYNLYLEFDEEKTNDSIFGHYCDTLQHNLQFKIYQDTGCQNSLDKQSYNVYLNNPKAREILAKGATTAFDICYETDRGMYDIDENAEKFGKVLDYVRYRNTNI